MNNPYDLSDEEIYGGEPTWEELEIEKLKGMIRELEDKLEDKECIIEMAIDYIEKHPVNACHDILSILQKGSENNDC